MQKYLIRETISPGELLSSIPAAAIASLPHTSQILILEEIAQMHTTDLFSIIPLKKLHWYSNILYQAVTEKSALSFKSLLQMENLLFYSSFLEAGNWTAKFLPDFLDSKIQPGSKTLCLETSFRENTFAILQATYGLDTSSWNEFTLASIGDLMITIPTSDLEKISLDSLSLALNSLLRQSRFDEMLTIAGEVEKIPFVDACVTALKSEEGSLYFKAYKSLMRKWMMAAQFMIETVQNTEELLETGISRNNGRIRRHISLRVKRQGPDPGPVPVLDFPLPEDSAPPGPHGDAPSRPRGEAPGSPRRPPPGRRPPGPQRPPQSMPPRPGSAPTFPYHESEEIPIEGPSRHNIRNFAPPRGEFFELDREEQGFASLSDLDDGPENPGVAPPHRRPFAEQFPPTNRPVRPFPQPRPDHEFQDPPRRPGVDDEPFMRPGPDFEQPPRRPASNFEQPPRRPGQGEFDERPMRPGPDFEQPPRRPAPDFDQPSMRPGRDFEPLPSRPGQGELGRPQFRPGQESQLPPMRPGQPELDKPRRPGQQTVPSRGQAPNQQFGDPAAGIPGQRRPPIQQEMGGPQRLPMPPQTGQNLPPPNRNGGMTIGQEARPTEITDVAVATGGDKSDVAVVEGDGRLRSLPESNILQKGRSGHSGKVTKY